MTHYWHYK